jgi:hypothetical protein
LIRKISNKLSNSKIEISKKEKSISVCYTNFSDFNEYFRNIHRKSNQLGSLLKAVSNKRSKNNSRISSFGYKNFHVKNEIKCLFCKKCNFHLEEVQRFSSRFMAIAFVKWVLTKNKSNCYSSINSHFSANKAGFLDYENEISSSANIYKSLLICKLCLVELLNKKYGIIQLMSSIEFYFDPIKEYSTIEQVPQALIVKQNANNSAQPTNDISMINLDNKEKIDANNRTLLNKNLEIRSLRFNCYSCLDTLNMIYNNLVSVIYTSSMRELQCIKDLKERLGELINIS